MTEEDKLRLKILRIRLRRLMHRGARITKKQAKKIGLAIGVGLISLCNANAHGFKELLASAEANGKTPQELLTMVEKQAEKDSSLDKLISQELSEQIRYLAEELMYARTDSLSASIDRLKNPQTRKREIRNNFKDATGISQVAFHCMATQCAADYRALKAMGLGEIIPQDLRQVSGGCSSYLSNKNITPFVYEVANTDKAIKACIREHNLSGGCLVFYPRDSKGNYHAVSLDMPENEFSYNDSIDKILTSAANRESEGAEINTSSYRKLAPGRKALVVDKLSFFIAMLERHIEGKTLAEQTALLYKGGAKEFVAHLQKVTGQKTEPLLAGIEKTVFEAVNNPQDNSKKTEIYLLALLPIVARRKDSSELFDYLAELSKQEPILEKIEYLTGDGGKKFSETFAVLSSEEKELFYGSLNKISTDNNGIINNPDVIALQVAGLQQQCLSTQTWHQVALTSKKTSLKAQDKKTGKVSKIAPKILSKTKGRVKA